MPGHAWFLIRSSNELSDAALAHDLGSPGLRGVVEALRCAVDAADVVERRVARDHLDARCDPRRVGNSIRSTSIARRTANERVWCRAWQSSHCKSGKRLNAGAIRSAQTGDADGSFRLSARRRTASRA